MDAKDYLRTRGCSNFDFTKQKIPNGTHVYYKGKKYIVGETISEVSAHNCTWVFNDYFNININDELYQLNKDKVLKNKPTGLNITTFIWGTLISIVLLILLSFHFSSVIFVLFPFVWVFILMILSTFSTNNVDNYMLSFATSIVEYYESNQDKYIYIDDFKELIETDFYSRELKTFLESFVEYYDICPNCGANANKDDKECQYCGISLEKNNY